MKLTLVKLKQSHYTINSKEYAVIFSDLHPISQGDNSSGEITKEYQAMSKLLKNNYKWHSYQEITIKPFPSCSAYDYVDFGAGKYETLNDYTERVQRLFNRRPQHSRYRRSFTIYTGEEVCLENTNGGHYKFYNMLVTGRKYKAHYGKIGTDGVYQEKTFRTIGAALQAAQKKIDEKLDKGYDLA